MNYIHVGTEWVENPAGIPITGHPETVDIPRPPFISARLTSLRFVDNVWFAHLDLPCRDDDRGEPMKLILRWDGINWNHVQL